MNNADVISIKQLPIIEEKLQNLKLEIEARTSEALNLECTDETVKDVKKVRAELKKEFEEFEQRRKFVKSQIEEPYNRFNEVYKECVLNTYKNADAQLKRKIDSVEDLRKAQKREKVLRYAKELKTAYTLNWLAIERVMPNITLSASESSLIDKVTETLEKIDTDIKYINTIDDEQEKAEIFAEYQICLNLAKAQTVISDRHKSIEQAKKQSEQIKQQQEVKQETENRVDEVIAPPVIEKPKEKEYRMHFTVVGTLTQLKEMKKFLNERGIKYE